MPTIVQTVNGKVTGLWGSALRRTPTGQLVALKMGDVIHTGDVILTTQDGIVELKPEADTPQTAAKPPETDDIDRVIAELNQPDSDTAPAAGLTGGDGSGLQPGLRVDRIAEGITAGTPTVARETEPAPAPTPFNTVANGDQAAAGAATPANAQPTASAAAVSVNEDTTLPVSLGGHDTDGSITAVTVVSVPAGSTLLLADGVTPVVAGQTLTPAEAAGLLFRPAPDFNGGVAVTFTVTDNQGGVSAPASVQIDVLPVNDSPIAHTGIASLGPEFSAIPLNLSGSDIDGTVTGVTITTAPAGGSLFLADGVTPVVPGTVLTASQAANLVFVGDAGFTGPTTIGFTVTDDQGATSAPATAQVSVTPVPTTLTLDSSAAAVAEGGSVVYTASVDHAVSGSPLVVTLTNGATITIPVGQTSGSSAPVVPRTDDAYAQGDQTQTIGVAGTSGASFSSLVTSDTVATTVSDDLDTTTVSLGASAGTVAEGGSIVYTASVNNPVTGSPLVITLSNGQTVTIPVGQSSASSAPFAVRADDAYAQGDQDLTVSITGTQGGQYEALANGPAVTTTVTDNADASTVSLTASAASVTEGGSIVYTASVNNPVTDSPLVLTLSNGQTITIPVGQSSGSSAPFAVRPDDALVQGDQTLSVGIATTSGGHYEVLSPAGNAVTIVSDDADPTTVTLTASAASVTEGGSIVYTAALSNAVTGVPLVITLSNGQTITIPVGQSSGSSAAFAVRADDGDLQGTETLSVDVASTSGGNFEALTSTGPATTTVSDDADATTVTLTASAGAVNEGGSIVYTASVDHPVTGAALEITLTNGQHITIPVGQSSADSAPFAVRADDLYAQGGQALPVGIAGTSGGNYESLVTTSTVSTLVQDDHDASTVSLSATPAVAEGGGIVYTATLTAPAQTDVTVNLSNNATITIAAGSSSGSVVVAAPADDVYTSAGTVSATITTANGGGFESLSIDPAAASTAVSDTLDTTTVSLTGAASVAEGAAAGYTVSLTSPARGDVTVTLSYSGTAADGSDFTGVATVTIPDGASSASFSIATLDDAVAEGAESFTVAVASATGGSFESLVVSGSAGAVTTGIVDNDVSSLSLTATPSLTEAGGSIVYTATLTQAPVSGLDVTLSNGAVIHVNAGDLTGTVSVPVAPNEDVYVDPTSVSASITAVSGGGIALSVDNTPAVTTIADTVDTTTVSLTASPAVAEGGFIQYTATLTSAAQTAVTVDLSNGHQIVIAAGDTTGSVSVAAPGNDVYLSAGNVSAQITAATGGNFEQLAVDPAPAVTAVSDTLDTTTVWLAGSPAATEGGSIVYIVLLSAPAQTPMTVTLSNGAQLNIAAGHSSASIVVPAPVDDVYTGPTSVTTTITSAVGGNFEAVDIAPGGVTTALSDVTDTTTVSLTGAASVAEGAAAGYTVSLTSPARGDVTVTLSYSGTAADGSDFTGVATVTIPDGASSASFSIATLDDAIAEGAESFTVAVASATGGSFESLVVSGSAGAVTTGIIDNDVSSLSLAATPSLTEAGGSIVYTATLTQAPVTDLDVTLSNGAHITIAAGTLTGTVSVPVAPNEDVYVDPTSLSASITAVSGGGIAVSVDSTPAVTTIVDTVDTTTVSLAATPAVAEGGFIQYTATLTSAAQTAVTVDLSNGHQIVIAAGDTTGSVSVAAPGNDVYLSAGNVSAQITAATGGNFEQLAVDPAPAVTAVSDTLDTTTIWLTGSPIAMEGGNILYIVLLAAPAQTPVDVTLSDGTTLTIPTGSASASIMAPAPADDVYANTPAVTTHIVSAVGGNFESLVIDPTGVTTTLIDTPDATTLSLSATPAVAEGGSIVYTATLTHVAQTDVTVTLTTGDQFTIAAGSSSASVTVAAPANDVYTSAGTVSASITTATGGNFEMLVLDPTPATTAVSDTLDTTTVSLTGAASVAEGAAAGYTVSLTSPARGDVTVTLSYSGTAADGSDFTGVATVTIPDGASSASFSIATLDDAIAEGAESFTVAVASATGGSFESLVVSGAAGAVTTGIVDNDVSSLSLAATPTLTEAGGSIVYTATLTQAPVTDLDVTLSNGAHITITAGTLTGTVSVPVASNEDVYVDPTSLSASITAVSGGGIAVSVDSTPAVTTIVDTVDTTTVSLTASPAVAEGGSIVYTATLSSPAHGDVTVTLTNGAVFTIASGSTSGSVAVTADNDVYVGAPSVSAAIATATGGGFEQLAVDPAAATTTVSDTLDTTTVSLTGAATVVEGAAAGYTVSLTSPAQADVTVTLNYSGTAANGSDYTGVATVTIPAGSSSASFSVPTLADGLSEGNESLVVSLAGATGGNFEQLALDATAGSVSTTLIDSDGPPSITIDNVVVNEATGQATFTVTLSAVSAQTVTVDYATADGSATAAGGDYTAASGSVTFAPGQTTQTVTVSINNDTTTEPNESFSVNLSNASNATIATPQGLATIVDNDAPPAIDLDADNSSGATGANHAVTFTEGMAGVPIADTDIVVTDADSSSLTGATITLTNRQPGDALNLGLDVAGITANVVSTAGTVTITLSGNASPADYAQRIGNISFTNTDQDPSATPRTVTVAVTDGTHSSNLATTTINVVGVNDPALITPAVAGLTETDAVLTTGGTLAISDVDSPASFVAQTNVAGTNGYGHFTLASNGVWTYTTDTAHNEFVAGTTYTDTLTVTSADGTTSTITVNILGTNDSAVITPAVVNLTETNAVLTTGGTLAISDVDSPATFVAQSNVAGSNGYGHFTLASNGVWTYTTDTAHNEFAAGTTYTDTLTVTASDGTTSTITVNILGTNDAAVIAPATVTLTETNAVLSTGGTLAISDVDSPATFVAQANVAGSNGYGHFTVGANGAWTYTTDTAHNEFVAGTTYTDSLTVTAADGTTSTITVNILGTNDAAVITPATVSLTETNAVLTTGGTLAISDVDSPATFVAQSNVAGSNGYGHFTLASNGAWTYTTDTAHNEFAAGTTYTDTLTVTSADGTTSTITVNILGTNDAAVITPAVVNLTETNAVLTTGGTLAISDVDSPATFVAQTNVAGSTGYGHFTLASNGAWTYTTDTAHNEFAAGTTYTDTLTVTSADGTTSTITVNILGTNDAAVIAPAVVSLTETNAVLTTGGTLAISDVDSPATFVAQTNVAGANGYGRFTLASNGAWTYTTDTAHNEFAAGTTYTDTLTVTAADGTTSTITVNILGTNDAAVITPATANLTETNAVLTTGGTLAISDVDSPATFVAQTNVAGSAGYGHFSLAANGSWTYTTDTAHNEFAAGTTYTDTLTVTSSDGTTSTITINILGTNDAAVITPATVNLTETNAVLTTGGTLAITDVDSPATFVAQTNVAGANGYGHFTLASNGAWTYTADSAHDEFVAGTTYTDTLTVTSIDGSTSTITVNILGTNDAAVIAPATVTLTETNAVLSTGGTLAISDVDSPATFVAQANVAGSNGYGHFTVGANGAWTYTTDTAHNELAAGTTYTDQLTVTSIDGTTSTITVSILGTNDAAVISAPTVALTETNAILTTGGTLTIADVDSAATFVAQSNVAGANGYGHFTLATNGAWTYTTDTAHNEFVAGSTYTDTLTVTAADGTTSTITVNILGTNDSAVITPAVVNLTETNAVLTTGGTLAISDVDSPATFVAQTNVAGSNGYGHFTLATNGAWTYTTDTAHNEFAAGTTYTDTLTVTSADGTTSTITVNILGTNDAAVITPATVNLTETNAVLTTGGTLAISDVDSPATFVAQTNVAGTNGYGHFTLASNGVWTYTTDTAHNEFVAGTTYTDTLTVTSADGTTSTITVNILGTNDAAVITPATVNLTETNAVLTTGGTLAVSDVDSPATFVAQTNVAGSAGYGHFTLASNGAWTYTTDTAHNEFAAGTTYTDTLTVTSADGTTSTITVNILGTNDAAVISPAVANLTETNAVLTTGGMLAVSDVDSPATFVAQTNVAGSAGYGHFTLASNGAWTYTTDTAHNEFAAGTTYTDTLTVTSADGTTSTITVNILGTNDAAVISPAVANLTETNALLTTGGTLAISDVDSPATFLAQTNVAGTNGYGHFTLASNGVWTYTTDTAHNEFTAGTTYTDTLTATSADGTTSTITVNILGTNDAAVITPATVNLTETNAVLTTGGTLAISDVDSPTTFVAQTNVAGSAGYGHFTLASNGAWTYTTDTAHNEFAAGTTYTDTLTVTSADGTTSTITVNILGTNDAAVITPAVANLTETNAVLTTGGTLAISDADSPATFVTQTNVAGSAGYGHFNVAADGTWTYTTDTAHNEFVAGTTYTDTLTVTAADGTTSTITVHIAGTNDAAILTPATVTLTETNAVLTTGGTLAIADVDSPATFVAQTNVAGAGGYGHFSLAADGSWTYTTDTAHNEFAAGTTYTDTLAVTSADGTTTTITVHIVGTNDAAVITPAVANLTETNAVLTTGGTLAISDVDSPATFVAQTNVAGSAGYGHFTLGANGAWTYTTDTAHNEFVAGTTYTDTLTVTSADGTTSTITVNILGTNDTAVIAGTSAGNVVEDGGVNNTTAGTPGASGALSVSDADAGQSSFQAPANLNGTYGTFTFNASTGAWTYVLDNTRNSTQALVAGQTVHDTLTVSSADGSASRIIDVTVNGSNDNASIAGTSAGSVTEAGGINNAAAGTPTATGTLAVSDVDNGQAVFQAPAAGSLNGTYGTFTFNASTGAWTYALDNTRSSTQALVAGQTVHDTLTVTSADGTASRLIDVTVNGTNDNAAISGTTTGTVTEAGGTSNGTAGTPSASGTLAVADVDNAGFQTPPSLAGTYGTFTFNASTGAWSYALDNTRTATQALLAGQVVHDTLTVTSTDGTASQVIDVTVNGSNDNAAISGTATATVTEAGGAGNTIAGTPTASGSLAVADVDNGQAVFQTPASLVGTYGTFTFNASTGAWTYALDNTRSSTQALTAGQVVHDTLTVSSADGTASRVIDVTVNGANDNATIGGTATGSVTEAGGINNGTAGAPTATGTLTVADVDAGQAAFQAPASLAGTYGSFTFNATSGAWTYTLDNTRAATQGLTAGQVVHDTLTVTSSDGTASQIIDVTVNGANDNASITGTATGSVTEAGGASNGTAGTPTASGTLTASDVDAGQAAFQAPASLAGTYGTFAFNAATGAWTYTLDNTRGATQALIAGQQVHDTLTVSSADGTASQIIDVTVTGANDNASIAGTATGTVTEAGGINNASAGTPTATGTLAVTDVDAGQAGFQAPASLAGTYGTFAFNTTTGAWTYTLDNTRTATQSLTAGQTVHDTLTVTSTDGSASRVIDVTVNGANDSATITGTATGAVTEAGGINNATAGTPTANGTLAVSDVDAGQAGFQTPASLAGTYGSFTFNTATGAWTYTLDNTRTATQALTAGQQVHDTLTIASSDGSASQVIDVTVTGANDSAVIGGTTTGAVTEDVAVNGSGNLATGGTLTVTDVDAGQASFQAGTTTGAYGSFVLAANGAWTYTASNANAAIQALATGQSLVDTFTVRSADGTASSVSVTINGSNDAPVATGSAVTGTEDTALVFNWANFGVTDIDTASSSLGVRITSLPADGTLQVFNGSSWVGISANTLVSKATIDAGSLRFVPDANESGSDAYGGSGVGNQQADYARFNFTPNDGSTNGASAMMRIDITPAADTPSLTHNASAQVTGTLSTLTSVGLSRDYYQGIQTLASGNSSTNPDVGETGIETAVPTSSALVTNVGVAGNLSNDTGVQVAADDAYRVQGLIYLEAGKSYTFSGYADDTVRLELGGNTLMSGAWGVVGQAQSGTFTSSTFAPTVTGYYSLEFMVYNTSGPGSYDLNVSVNGATAVDLSTSNFLLFQSINQVDAAGAQRSAFVPNTTTGEGGYYPVSYDTGVQSKVYLAPVLAGLTDTDGSESLAVQMQAIPVGATLTDGVNSFTATAGSTSVNVTTWDRSHLAITLPDGYAGSTSLTAVATATEGANGASAVTSTSFAVTVDALGTTTTLAEIATFNADAIIGLGGDDVFSVSQNNAGLDVTITQGATGSIVEQSGTDTTATIHQAFYTGGGNDLVQSGAGNDTIYLGDSGSAIHPVSGSTATQANVLGAQMMNLADTTALTSSSTGLFTNEAVDSTSSNNRAGNTDINTWADVANAGSGDDVVYGQNGTDFLYGGTGNDYLNGGAGIDGLRGGAGNDTLVGGAGNDVLRGDAGADVFKWEFADRGTTGAPASDIIMDFNTATPGNGGDVLDLRDLLQGESTTGGAPGNLSNYLHFTVSGGNTTIQISSSGGFSGGYSAGAVDQSIVLQNVDLTSGGALGTDQQIIQDLLNKSKLIVDGS